MRNMMKFGVLLLMLQVGISTIRAEVKPMVSVGDDGELVYTSGERGNKIVDFSLCGYGGGTGIPNQAIPVRKHLAPVRGNADDTARIQAAIDELSARDADKSGWRGALFLKRGVYRVAGTLDIKVSGVVLRGEGQGERGTVLLGTGTVQRDLIVVGGNTQMREVKGSRRKIQDSYVPVGAMSLSLESTEGFSVGDVIVIFRPSTTEWISEIKMDQIPGREGRLTKQWEAGSYDLRFERCITSTARNKITLDAPIVNAMEDKYGGGSVYRYTEKGRISQSGVESLRLVSEYKKGQETKDEAHAWTGVSMDHVVNGWVRNLTTVHFSHAVNLGRMAKFVTVQDCASLKPVSLITGGHQRAVLPCPALL